MRQGKLTPEEADEHPQRSIITRALGAEEGVEADSAHVAGARRRRLPDLLGRPDLDDPRGPRRPRSSPRRRRWPRAGRTLIDAANDAGGRDNITVVLFRLEEVGAAAPRAAGRPPSIARRRPASRARPPRRRAAAPARPRCRARRARAAPRAAAAPGAPPAPRASRSARSSSSSWSPAWSSGAYYASQTVYFVGASNDGFVTRLPRTALRPAGRAAPVLGQLRVGRARSTSSRRRRSRRSPSTSCAPRTTRRTSSRQLETGELAAR